MRLIHEKYREIEEARRRGAKRSVVPPGEGRTRFSPVFRDSRMISLAIPPQQAFAPIRRVGGNTGWFYGEWLWRVRGWMDRKKKLEEREGWGEQSVAKLLAAIEARRAIALDKFIYALGIPQVGQATARLLAKHYRSLAKWLAAMREAEKERKKDPDEMKKAELVGAHYAELRSIEQIGFSVADEIVEFFGEKHNLKALEDLAGEVAVEDFSAPAAKKSAISGKTIVFTGTLAAMGRNEAKARAEALGATVASSVSKKTDIVVVGADAGSKAKKAEELGIDMMDEDAWLKLAGA